MSFYGQAKYQFEKIFNAFKVKNSGKNSITIVANPEEATLIPKRERQTLNFDTDNKWIVLNADTGTFTVKLSHNGDESIKGNYPGFEADKTELDYGDTFSTSIITVDEAGHVSGVNTLQYKLPISADEANLEERFTAIENVTTKFVDDLSPSNIDSRLDTLEAYKENHTAEYIETFEELRQDVETNYIPRTEYGNNSEVITTESYRTLTQALGALNEFNSLIKDLAQIDEDVDFTFAQGIKILAQRLEDNIKTSGTNTLAIGGFEAKIKTLEDRVKTLEEKTDNEELV